MSFSFNMVVSGFDSIFFFPELFIAVSASFLLVFGACSFYPIGGRTPVVRDNVSFLSLLVAVLSVFVLVLSPYQFLGVSSSQFSGFFVSNDFTFFAKSIFLLLVSSSLFVIRGSLRAHMVHTFEYTILILFASVGLSMLLCSSNFLSLYLCLELQSLIL